MIYIYKDTCCPRGLFAYMWSVVDMLRRLEDDDSLYIDLTTGTEPYYDPNYTRTNNVWEYYFEQPFGLTKDCYNHEHKELIFHDDEVCTNFLFGIKDGKYRLSHSPKIRAVAKRMVDKHIRIQPHILDKVNEFYAEYMANKKILGIHVRGGNMYVPNVDGYTGHGRLHPEMNEVEYYYNFVDEQLDDYDSLFLMTNDFDVRNKFKEKYGSKLIYYDSDLLSNEPKDLTWLHTDRNYEKGEVAVVEILLLNRCDKMLITSSNISIFATIYGNTEYQFLDEHVIVHY